MLSMVLKTLVDDARVDATGQNERDNRRSEGVGFSDHGGLFQLSMGIGGVGLILSRRAAIQWRLLERALIKSTPTGFVGGAGGERAQLKGVDDIISLRIPQVELMGTSFQQVRSIVHVDEDPRDLELSVYADGVLCSEVWRGCCFVLDGPRMRVSVMPLNY
ncbi:hypothetical protein CYMTET_15427 [Cymbomonas tetramitiformis]|uniref:Uncharacterized protein n=1 Tax=Cymbomonas tetramitiformis TaxID=36881 RepID=A0AAE0GEE2_9CHLO|nr:hypothetical protein CYMTET_15427 [Cymbomonas tetramitiformis]